MSWPDMIHQFSEFTTRVYLQKKGQTRLFLAIFLILALFFHILMKIYEGLNKALISP